MGAGPVGPLLPSRQVAAKRQPSRGLVPVDMLRSEEGGLSDIEKADVAGGLQQLCGCSCEGNKAAFKQLMLLSCQKEAVTTRGRSNMKGTVADGVTVTNVERSEAASAQRWCWSTQPCRKGRLTPTLLGKIITVARLALYCTHLPHNPLSIVFLIRALPALQRLVD